MFWSAEPDILVLERLLFWWRYKMFGSADKNIAVYNRSLIWCSDIICSKMPYFPCGNLIFFLFVSDQIYNYERKLVIFDREFAASFWRSFFLSLYKNSQNASKNDKMMHGNSKWKRLLHTLSSVTITTAAPPILNRFQATIFPSSRCHFCFKLLVCTGRANDHAAMI